MNTHPRRAAAWLGAAWLGTACTLATASDCGHTLDARQRQVLAGRQHTLVFVPQPAPLASGRHFGLDIVVCPKAGAGAPAALRVDADMPAHGHGMNYRPTVRVMGAPGEGQSRYRAEGLLLHMPGRWRLHFELSVDGRIERLSHDLDLR
ncbi:hypothetical protein [Pseudorhodoferax sp.]|uniref:hypothetical protein n=1 Tax=Pseudorhodoferax sp. TaxID=1993553 RepID=UPI002DD63605|nr:hypothetical protein [Pseudorhodoferax sp.]